jgi:chromate transporter
MMAGPEREVRGISLARLLVLFLRIRCIGFGGGMAIIALIEREVVKRRKLLPLEEFLHGICFGQILGSFAVNAALFVGYRLFGPVGGVLSAIAFLLPSVAMVIGLSHLYFEHHSIPAMQAAVAGLGPVVVALILDAGWSIGRKVVRTPAAAAIAAAALVAGIAKVNTVWVLLCAGALSYALLSRSEAQRRVPSLALAALPAAGAASIGGTFFKIGMVFFGGGFVLVPILHEQLVTGLHWLTAQEFIDGVAISNLTPGPIAVLATFAGFHLAGVGGALIGTAALLAPGLLVMMLLTRQYERLQCDARVQRFLCGVNPAVTGLVVSAAFLLGGGALTGWRACALAAVSLGMLRKLKWHPAVPLAVGAAAGFYGWI